MWSKKIRDIQPIQDLVNIPSYGFQFFFKNIHPHALWFSAFTLISVAASGLSYYAVYLLGDIISHVSTLSWDVVFHRYLPLYGVTVVLKESCDFFIRKYGEAFPIVYCDHLRLRFYVTLLNYHSPQLLNLSKERLNGLVTRYISNVQWFLNNWFWGTSRRITVFGIVLFILYQQSVLILALNIIYILLFLSLSFTVSSRFSKFTREHTQQMLKTGEIVDSFLMQFNTVRRLNLKDFFINTAKEHYNQNWDKLETVRNFHAFRWLIQLNLFNILYVGTLFYGVRQVTLGQIPVGFLLLIKYAYDQLWQFLVFLIEYYISMINQREIAKIIREEMQQLVTSSRALTPPPGQSAGWKHLSLKNVRTEFRDRETSIITTVTIPELEIRHGDKVGIIGPSGSGKSTCLNILLNLIPFQGEYLIDGEPAQTNLWRLGNPNFISRYDPLFNITLSSNITLGQDIPGEKLRQVLAGVQAQDFTADLDKQIGDPFVHLSTGQEQRIRIARGLLRDSDLYLLDEALSGIDDSNRDKILDFLGDYLKTKTVILVTHDVSDLQLVDKVYEIREGVLRPTKIK